MSAFISATPVSVSRPAFAGLSICTPGRPQTAKWTMGKPKFGLFSPVVLASKVVLGKKRLIKLRAKAISYHSQAITGFCEFTGAGPAMRQVLIRQAKSNGENLGFLS